MKIKELSSTTINRIAAGEVVERPSSAIKELLENSIDANSTQIDILINSGGRNLISVADNGCGMSPDEMNLAVQRHTTSKLNEEDISDIQFFGFRGEALPSIASVSRMNIISNSGNNDHAWSLEIHGGSFIEMIPASYQKGTKIIVRDLFYATPARLKFLRSEKQEAASIIDIVKRIAMAHPHIGFTLKNENKSILNLHNRNKLIERIKDIMGDDFCKNSVEINSNYDECFISGFTSLPTFNRGTSSEQYFFINNRYVKDKLLISSLKVAYMDFLSSDRYPISVLFITIPPKEIDVNVHPAKTEVRFKDPSKLRNMMISAIKNALSTSSYRVSNVIADNTISSFIPQYPSKLLERSASSFKPTINKPSLFTAENVNKIVNNDKESIENIFFSKPILEPSAKIEEDNKNESEINESTYPLGAAKCQLHDTYIVSQTQDSIIIVDQHAAHERLVYEELKKISENSNVQTQRILMPEIIELPAHVIEIFIDKQKDLERLGLKFRKFNNQSIIISEVPIIIGTQNIVDLVHKLADDLLEHGEDINFTKLLQHIAGTFACHHSIRAGRKLNIYEMNALLRKMEKTTFSGQCNHGRPTYVELKLTDIEKLFGRK